MRNLRHILMMALFTIVAQLSFGQGLETFDNFTATGSSYQDGTFLGQDGSEWNYIQSRGDVEITGKALMLGRNRTPQANVYSGTISNGIGTLNFDYMQAFSSNVNLNILVNDVVVGNVTSSGEQNVIKNSGEIEVNISGDFFVKFMSVNNSDGQVVIDNVTWTSGSGNSVASPQFNPIGGTYTSPQNVSISSTTPGAIIYYTTDDSNPTQQSQLYTQPVTIAQTTTLKARAYAFGLDPSNITTAQYVFPVTVTSLAALRAGVPGQLYHYTGTAVLTFQQGFRNQKYVQDATAGILIDDLAGIITSDFEIGDGITNLWGHVAEFGGMMQFSPTQDPGDPVSSGNNPAPLVITLTELNDNYDNYDARLVRVNDVTFDDAGATFVDGAVYHLTGPAASEGDFRATFYGVDYIGTPIPSGSIDIIGLPNSRVEGKYLTARNNNDFVQEQVPPTIQVLSPNGGEVWQKGNTYTISWLNTNFSGNVKITIPKGFTSITLAANVTNTGSYEWTIPMSFVAGSYKVKVEGVNPSDPVDISDGNFSIIEPLPDPDIVINEIMYKPATALGPDSDYEYLELYNNSGFAVDLAGWKLATAIDYTFEAGTTIADGAYLVVALKPDTIISHYGITNVVGPFTGGLNNTGEIILLLNVEGDIADSVKYAKGGLWPPAANGDGPSLELLDPNLDNSLPENWAASIVNDGTPGMPNSVFGFEMLTLTAPNGGESFLQGSSQQVTWTYVGFTGTIKIQITDTQLATTVTLAENVPVNSGVWDWEIPANFTTSNNYKIIISETTDGIPTDESDDVFSIIGTIVPSITVTSPNGGESWAQGTLHNITWTSEAVTGDVKIELSNGVNTILLEGAIAASAGTYAWAIPAGQALGSNYTVIISGLGTGTPTDASDAPFSIVAPPPLADIVINEIMYNPPESGADSLEYIELYNRGAMAVNLEDYYFSKGVVFVFPNYELVPGGYVVVAIKANVMLNEFGVEALQWTAGGLSNSGEAIVLMNNAGQQVDSVYYKTGGVWPAAANGYGPSLSLTDPFADNSDAANWKPETTFAFNHPLGMGVYATPGAVNFSTPGQGILLNSGLSGISTYLDLNNQAVETNMNPIVDNLIEMQNFSNVYLPGYNVNSIGNWNTNKGYQINVTSKLYLVLYGTESTNHTAALATGWNGLPVLSSCAVEAATLFDGHAEIILVKEMGSNRIYYPAGNTFTLQTLQPGSAYFIKVSAPINLTYPDCGNK